MNLNGTLHVKDVPTSAGAPVTLQQLSCGSAVSVCHSYDQQVNLEHASGKTGTATRMLVSLRLPAEREHATSMHHLSRFLRGQA